MKRKYLLGLAIVAGLSAFLYAATGDIVRWTGWGSRRNTLEFKIGSPSDGTAASFLPGTNNANPLGSSSYRFSNVYTTLLNVSGAITASSTLNVTDTLTTAGKRICTPTAVTALYVSSSITPTSEYVLVGSTGNAITLTSTPNISTTGYTTGQFLTLKSTGPVVTLQDVSALANSGVSIGAASLAVSSSTARTFIFDGTNWCYRN